MEFFIRDFSFLEIIHTLDKHILFVQLFYTNFVDQINTTQGKIFFQELDDRSKLIRGMNNTFAFLFEHR